MGGTITIDGIGFGAVQGVNDKVFVNGVEATVTFWSDTQIVITVPSTASGDIVVDLNGMMSNPVFLRVSTGPFAYVTCEDADVVGVIDMGTLERAGAIDVSNSPVGLVIHPDGSRLYVGRSAPDEITMIDLDTHEATDLGIPGLDGPRELAIHPDGDFLFAMNRPQNEISVIETVTHTEIDTDFNGANGLTRITGITADEDMDVNPEGTILVAGGYHIVDVDPDSAPQPGGTRYTVLGTFTTLPFSTFDRFIFLDDGEDAWRTDRSQSPPMPDDPIETVDVMKMFLWQGIDLDQNVTTTSPNAPTGITRVITREGPWGLAVSGDAVWVGNTDHDSISEIDGVTRTELAVHPVEADFPWDLDVDRAGATLAIIGRNDDTVTIWDIGTTSSLGDFSVGDLPAQIVIAPATTAEALPPRLADLDTRIGAPGDVINLRGARFDPTPANNLVHFAGAPPVVPSAGDATMLTVTVPVGATTGPVQVEDTISGLFSNRIRFHVPAGTLAYVAGGVRRDGVLVVDLDPAVREVIGFIPTGANPGPDPRRVAVVPAGAAKEDDIWVTNWADDTVTIIDGLTHLVVGDLAAGPAPEDIAMTPSGAFAYLVSTMDDTVRKFDTDLRNDTGITIGAIPDDFDLAMDPTALWLYAGGNQRIDITTDLKVGPDTGIVGPCEFENTGAKAYITIGGMNEVAIWDVALLMEAGPRIPIAGGGPQQIAADPTLDQVYVVNTLLDSVSMIDTISDVEIDADGPGLADRIVPGSTLLSFVTADANSIVYILAGGEGVMSLVDASVVPVTKIADITVGDGAQAVAIGN